MWEREQLGLSLNVGVEEEVEVERAWTAGKLARAARRVFDAEEAREELFGGGERWGEFGDHVEEGRLVGHVNRLGLVKGREARDAEP